MIPRDSEYIKCCVGPIQYKDFQAVNEDMRVMKKVGTKKSKQTITETSQVMEKNKPVDGAFLTAASPGVVALFQVNKYFATHEEYISALVPELAKEYAKIVENGFLLQLDCPDLAMGRHHAYAK